MASNIVCVGSKALVYPHCEGRTHLRVSRKIVALSPIPAGDIFLNAPPFVVFVMDREGTTPIDAIVLNMIDDCRFDDGRLVAVPWTWVLHWAHFSTGDRGNLFLEKLTLGTNKKELRPKARKRKRVAPLEDVVTLSCSSIRHASICATSRILTMAMVDRAFYEETGVILCKRCNHTMRQWSGDGFLNLATVRPVLNHMERDPEIVHLIDMLLQMCMITVDMVGYYRFGDIRLGRVPLDFRLSLDGLFHDQRIQLGRLLPLVSTSWRLFNLHSSVELEIAVHAALHYRIFGRAAMKSDAPAYLTIAEYIPNNVFSISDFLPLPSNIEVIVVSVFSPALVKSIFQDTCRRVVSYTHVYALETDRLDIPGVDSISVSRLESINKTATIVVWPANTFTVAEISTIYRLRQPVILAGTPYLVPDRDLTGLFFTDLVEHLSVDGTVRRIGPDDAVARFIDVYPSKPISTHYFPPDRAFRLYCPVYEENENIYFDRVLLTGLIANSSYNFKNVSILPGELIATTLLATAVSGKHVRVSHRVRTF